MIKKLFYILTIFIFSLNCAVAQPQRAYLEYNGFQYEFLPGDEKKFIKNADKSFVLWQKTAGADKEFYLQDAMRYYFLYLKIKPDSIEPQIQLGRIYDATNQDLLSKKHFYTALNLDNKNPKANYYLGDFFYKRNDLITAIYYYKRAYKNGYKKNYELNYKSGVIYEKLGNLNLASRYYCNALELNKNNPNLQEKIRLLDELNYDKWQYDLFDKSGTR